MDNLRAKYIALLLAATGLFSTPVFYAQAGFFSFSDIHDYFKPALHALRGTSRVEQGASADLRSAINRLFSFSFLGDLSTRRALTPEEALRIRRQNDSGSEDALPFSAEDAELNVNAQSLFKEQTQFRKNVFLEGDLLAEGRHVELGLGTLSASNVLYALAAGDGIVLSGSSQRPTISLAEQIQFWQLADNVLTPQPQNLTVSIGGELQLENILRFLNDASVFFGGSSSFYVPDNLAGAWTIGTSTDAAPIMSLDSIGRGNILFGTSTPNAYVSIVGGADQNRLFVGTSDRTDFLIDENGNVGIGTRAATSTLSVAGTFSVTDRATFESSPRLSSILGCVGSGSLVTDEEGNIQCGGFVFETSPQFLSVTSCEGGGALKTDSDGLIYCGEDQRGGGRTAPEGSDKAVQFNNAGSFGGNSKFTYDFSASILTLDGILNLDGTGTSTFNEFVSLEQLHAFDHVRIGDTASTTIYGSATSTFTGGIFADAFRTNLPSCDSLDTDTDGAIICGTDQGGTDTNTYNFDFLNNVSLIATSTGPSGYLGLFVRGEHSATSTQDLFEVAGDASIHDILTVSSFKATSTNATSTIKFGLENYQMIAVGGTATTTIKSTGTSTFSSGIDTAGLTSSGGIEITDGILLSNGIINVTNAGTSTFTGGISTGGLASSEGIVWTAGILRGEATGTSTMAGGLDLGTSAGGLLLGLPSCNNLTTDSGGGVVCAATDPITSFTAAGDSGGGQSIANGNTLTLIGGKNITTIDAATDQITFNLNDILYSMDDIFATSSGASVYASSTIQGATLFAYTALGIGGTTSPAYPFSLDGKALFDSSEIRFGTTSADRINVTYYARSTTTIPDNTVGSFNIATSTGAGNQSILTITTATNRRATTSARGAFEIDGGAFAYNSYQGVTYADSFQAGPMAFDTDAGILSWVDMPVSTTTANIVMRYSAQIDSSPVLSIYATTTGTGLVNYGSVGIGTTSPIKRFSVSNGGVAVCSLADTSCNDTFTDGDIYATSRSGGAIDVAEWVKVGTSSLDSQGVSTIQPGEVLCTSLHEPRKVVRCGSKEARVPIGVASTRPHLTMGAEYDGPDAVRLALTGRVPVQVNLDGGEIASGDYLALASMEGIAAKATTSGVAIGIALEAFDGNIKRENNSFAYVATGTIEMFINLGYAKLDTAISGGSVASSTFADPQTGELLTLGESLDMDNNDIVNIRGILSANGSWSIDENGNLKVVSIEAERIKTQQLEVGTTDKPFGTTLYDVENGQPYCAYIKAGQLQTVSGTCESNRYLFDKSQAPSTKPQTISNDQNSNTKTETQTNDAAVKEGGEGEQTENPTVSDGASEDSTQQSEPGLVTNDSIIADGDTVSSGDTVDTHKTVEVEGVEPSESEVTSPDPLPSTPTADESYQEHEEATSTSDTSGTQPIESDAIPQDTASDDQNKQETASSTNSSP